MAESEAGVRRDQSDCVAAQLGPWAGVPRVIGAPCHLASCSSRRRRTQDRAIAMPIVPRAARVVRASALSVQANPYIEAAQALGPRAGAPCPQCHGPVPHTILTAPLGDGGVSWPGHQPGGVWLQSLWRCAARCPRPEVAAGMSVCWGHGVARCGREVFGQSPCTTLLCFPRLKARSAWGYRGVTPQARGHRCWWPPCRLVELPSGAWPGPDTSHAASRAGRGIGTGGPVRH